MVFNQPPPPWPPLLLPDGWGDDMWHVCLCMWVCTYVCKIWGRMWRLALLMPDKCNTYVDVYAMYKYKNIIFYIKVRHMYIV